MKPHASDNISEETQTGIEGKFWHDIVFDEAGIGLSQYATSPHSCKVGLGEQKPNISADHSIPTLNQLFWIDMEHQDPI